MELFSKRLSLSLSQVQSLILTQISQAQVYVNRAIIHHFNWLADTIDVLDGINMLDVEEWGITDADLITYTDASLTGLIFTTPSLKLGFCSSIPRHSPLTTIFYFKALAITSAILWALGLEPVSIAC